MKKIIIIFCSFFILYSCNNKNKNEDEQNIIPNFNLKTFDGNTLSNKDFSKKKVVLSVVASWCEPCKDELNQIKELKNQYDSVLSFYIVTSESLNWVKPESTNIIWTYGSPEFFKELNIKSVPTRILLDDDKEIIRIQGNGPNDINRFNEAIGKISEAKK